MSVARYRYDRRRPPRRLVAAVVAGVILAGAGGHAIIHHTPTHAAAQAISYAEAREGCPYVWGGLGPCSAGYDCSGLIYEAYASAGVTIPRTSQAQWAGLPHIRPGHQRPGDLVFFAGADGTPAAPGHVGLVLSRDRMVEAYASGFPIRVSDYGTPNSPPGDQAPAGFARPTG